MVRRAENERRGGIEYSGGWSYRADGIKKIKKPFDMDLCAFFVKFSFAGEGRVLRRLVVGGKVIDVVVPA